MDKSTLRVHLANGGFNLVKFGDATDIKVKEDQSEICDNQMLNPKFH